MAWGDVEVVGDVWERCLGCVDLREGDESGGEECGEEVTVGTGWVGIGVVWCVRGGGLSMRVWGWVGVVMVCGLGGVFGNLLPPDA